MQTRRIGIALFVLLTTIFSAATAQTSNLSIKFDKYKLDNGLEVILHEDRSDPITAVAILFHVGSNREETGRTGFAHLFEHMLFQESQHVGQDQFFSKIQGAGGTLNGGTWEDGTIYFEIVPRNALEMVLWMESDRMGYLLPTVTMESFVNQQDVVQNEKRQRVDNVPYGHTNYVIHKLLYPEGHPYNWQVIGSFDDLKNATIEDIHKFFKKWYGPNNATLVVAGDFDVKLTRQWIEKYFGELQPSPPIPAPVVRNVTLTETKRAYHEDNFAQSPELNMVYPAVEQYSKDAYALDLFADLFADGKKAPLYKVIVEEKKLAPDVSSNMNAMELAGDFRIRVRAFPDVNLTDLESAVQEAIKRFETDKFTAKDLDRIKANTETQFYNGISSTMNKAFQLASYNEYAGDPKFISEDIERYLKVNEEDIWRVYNTYIKDKPYIITSFVPTGKVELVAANSIQFPVVEEEIVEASIDTGGPVAVSPPIESIPSSFDRTVEPPKGPAPEIILPKIWTHTYDNGLELYGIENTELPLVQFSLIIEGGLLLDDIHKVGSANLITDIMMEGTQNRTPLELEETIESLGARISMHTSDEEITIEANTLSSKVNELYPVFEEILLEPRWDEKEFERIKQESVERINQQSTNPAYVASTVFRKLLYGDEHILAQPTSGSTESINAITIDDLKSYYSSNFSPKVAHLSITGNLSKEKAVKLFSPLGEKWSVQEVGFPSYAAPAAIAESKLYFVDIPKAKQSQIRIGYLAMDQQDPDYYAASVMNYKLGGSFSGILNLILREEKGYTYGARSGFSAGKYPGPFIASSAVRSNTTFESTQIFMDELKKYSENTISTGDLDFTKSALIQSNALRLETLGAKRQMLENIALYNRPHDYVKRQEMIVRNMTLERHHELARKYIPADKMIYLIVGDAETQLNPLRELGLGEPVRLDTDGKVITAEM